MIPQRGDGAPIEPMYDDGIVQNRWLFPGDASRRFRFNYHSKPWPYHCEISKLERIKGEAN